MSNEELLKPRYMVITDYPFSAFKEGAVINTEEDFSFENKQGIVWLSEFPDIFKKLEWWEERKVEDMPEYLKVISGDFSEDHKKIGKVNTYNRSNVYIIFSNNDGTYRPIKNTLPATKEEYDAQCQTESTTGN